ncbi:MAG: menaquinone biosynthesis protein, partial [Candidatus Marsarchaeota archaeon]|nr:menaquinone biosynthesis protein [Candidatus Marsarchaeota archaeon]
GQVDIALISSEEFLKNRYRYTLLSDLGIATSKAIMSVRLFFKGPSLLLDKRPVYLPTMSSTSSKLLKVLCKYFWKVQPLFVPSAATPEMLFEQTDPFLLIGDPALVHRNTPNFLSIDLAEAWVEATNRSMVFALVATNNEALKTKPEQVMSFHRVLEQSYAWGKEQFSTIVEAGAKKTGLDPQEIEASYKSIEYRLNPKHFCGLELFSTLEA